MKLFLVPLFIVVFGMFIPKTGYADDIMIFEDGNRTLFSGTIIKQRGDTITIVTNGREVSVDIDKIDLEGTQRKMISKDMRVLVGGKFTNNGRTMRAKTLLLLTNKAMEEKIEAQLIAENVFDRY